MFEQSKCINIINSLIVKSEDIELINLLPISIEDLENDSTLCEMIIDYFGDIYVGFGFDDEYCENEYGKLISRIIDFIAECNE